MTDPLPDVELRFDGCVIRLDQRQLLIDGRKARLGARAFDVLLALVERRARVVGKDELLEVVWPGLVVEENNLQVHISALRKLLGAQAIATVPGRGYRFAMRQAGAVGAPAADPAQQPGADQPSTAKPVDAAAIGDDADGAGGPALPDKPSIAVLPFDNLGGDDDQESFIDGVTEDIITELSRFRSLFVVARNSSFSYKGKATDVRTIASQLGVRYVVEGSIRRAADRIRVTAQLIDASTGIHRWAERYDRALEDIFALQEELTQAIVTAIAPQIESTEFEKARVPRSGDVYAYELAMRARDTARRADREFGAASHDDALRLAEQALATDADCSAALTALAYLQWRRLWAGKAAAGDALDQGLAAARRAIAIDGADHQAHLWKGMLLLYTQHYEAGLHDLRRAHELNANDALTLSLLGQYEAAAGDAATGIRHASNALRLSPRDSLRWSFLNSLAWAQFAGGHDADAAAAAIRAIGEAPKFHPPRLCLVLALVGLQDLARARSEFAIVAEQAPQAIAARIDGRWNFADSALARRATTRLRIAAGVDQPSAGAAA